MGKHSLLGASLCRILEERKIDKEDFYTEMGVSRATFYNLLGKQMDSYKKGEVSIICRLLDIPPSELGLAADYFPTRFAGVRQSANEVTSLNFTLDGSVSQRPYAEKFFDTFLESMASAEHSFNVLDYSAKNMGIDNKDSISSIYYHQQNLLFFETLEAKMEKKQLQGDSFRYRRILQLPLDVSNYPFFSDENYEPIKGIIELLFDEAFSHMLRCFKKFPKYFRLFLLKVPMRLSSYYMIDDNSLISLHNRVDKNGMLVPDLLFHNRVREENQNDTAFVLRETYRADWKNIERIENEIYGNEFQVKTVELANDLKHQLNELDARIRKSEHLLSGSHTGENGSSLKPNEISAQITQLKKSRAALIERVSGIERKVKLLEMVEA